MRDSKSHQVYIPISEVIIRHRKGLAQLGLKNPWPTARGGQQLGTGSHGAAYDLGDKVLKLTNDRDEAIVSALIRGKSLRHVVKILDVWSLGDSARGSCPHLHYAATLPNGAKVNPFEKVKALFDREGWQGMPIDWERAVREVQEVAKSAAPWLPVVAVFGVAATVGYFWMKRRRAG